MYPYYNLLTTVKGIAFDYLWITSIFQGALADKLAARLKLNGKDYVYKNAEHING